MIDQTPQVIDFALTKGLLKYNKNFELTHAPLSLTPYRITKDLEDKLKRLTPVFNQLILKVSQNHDFLKDQLKQAAITDPFVEKLLTMLDEHPDNQPYQLLLNRNDYLISVDPEDHSLHPKQVELNTISVSFPYLAERMNSLHRLLEQDPQFPKVLRNNPLTPMVDAMAKAVEKYGYGDACVLMVVQHEEKNVFDQRGIEADLWDRHNTPCIRLSLEEIATQGALRGGHLVIGHWIVALTYFRAAYTPNDFPTPISWEGRNLIEASSSIKVPNLGMQLAGMKKIQQSLGVGEILKEFVDTEQISEVASTFVDQHLLNDPVKDGEETLSAKELACRYPDRYVLKPQREGGGNNYFDQEMVDHLKKLKPAEEDAYILMERIWAEEHQSILVVEGNPQTENCVSEVGQYGVCFAQGRHIQENKDVGYLVRTKGAEVTEGGVSAGFACLNSLALRT